MLLKTKWLKLKLWQRGMLVGIFLVLILMVAVLVIGTVRDFTTKQDCRHGPPEYPIDVCVKHQRHPFGYYLGFYKILKTWLPYAIIGISMGLEVLFGKLLNKSHNS